MKKILSLVLALMMLLCAVSAMAEAAPVPDDASLCPFNMPPIPEEMYVHWQLYTSGEPLEWQMSYLVDPDTNCYVVLLYNPLDWGIAAEYCTNWLYDTEAKTWVTDTVSDIRRENAIVLSVDAEYYYMNGFPGWECISADETFAYQLADYSGDPNNPDYHLIFSNADTSIQLAVSGEGFTMSSFGENAMSYTVYNSYGLLTTGCYMLEQEDVYASYAVIPNESSDPEAVEEEPYILYYINVQTADGGNYLWSEGAWQNIHGEEVKAPKGFSADELPFDLIGLE